MNNMKIAVEGYFDKNLGDDYMVRLIVREFPDVEFCIRDYTKYTNVFWRDDNISITSDIKGLPILVITGSGFMINSAKSLICEIVWFLKRKHVGDFCLGCNIEPLKGWLRNFLIKSKLNRFKLIVCRDRASYSWLKANCRKTKVYYLPDIVFSITDKSYVPDFNNKYLGISLMHRKGDTNDCLYYRKMAEIADWWIENTGNPVKLLAFDTGAEDDMFACVAVRGLMKSAPEMSMIETYDGDDVIIRTYQNNAKVIGARYHSAVLAIRYGVDFYPIVYRNKMKNLVSDLEYPIRGCSIDDIDTDDIKRFLLNDVIYTLDENVINSANQYAEIFKRESGLFR